MRRQLRLINTHGLHARPISQVVQAAQAHRARLTIAHAGRQADGRSVLELMSLGAGPEAEVELTAEGDDAPALMQAIVDLIESGFGET